MNRVLSEKNNPTAKLDSSGNKDRLFQSSSEKVRSNSPSNYVQEDGIKVQANTKQSGSQKEPSRRLYMDSRLMGEGAKKLSPEQMAALEVDIFKPLDFYEILFNRLKGSDKGKIISNINEL